jgi:glyoxylase-like metal-dependent hydrolase (beta-lactamase superfamily II)
MTESQHYTVTILKHGSRSTVKSDVFLNYPIYGEDDAPIDMDYFAWIIRNEERTVLVDTGFSRKGGESRNRTFLLDLPRAYESLGIEPSESPDVVVTHAHYDHTGNLDHFPTSRIILSRSEFEFWNGPGSRHTQFQHSVEDDDLAELRRAADEGRVVLFDDTLEIAPGIELIRVGGHTPGQSVVKVDTSEGVVLLASDAIHFYEEYERDMPFTFVADLVAMYDAFEYIKRLEQSGEVTHVVSGHDATTLSRFTPMAGEFAGLAATIGIGGTERPEKEERKP